MPHLRPRSIGPSPQKSSFSLQFSIMTLFDRIQSVISDLSKDSKLCIQGSISQNAGLEDAERQVRQSLESHNFELAIGVASHALVQLPRKMMTIEKALLCARSSAYERTGLYVLALTDAQSAHALDQDDPLPLLRAAEVMVAVGDLEKGEACLVEAEEKPQMLQVEEKLALEAGIQRCRDAIRARQAPHENRPPAVMWLPQEVLRQIFDQILPDSFVALMLVCKAWKRVLSSPYFSRDLLIRSKTTCAELSRCIDVVKVFSKRCGNSLERVTIVHPPRTCARLDDLLGLLIKSKNSLKHLALPVICQTRCYEQLYRHCKNLSSLDLSFGVPLSPSRSVCPNCKKSSQFLPEKPMPFTLKSIRGSCNARYGDLVPHLSKLRVLGHVYIAPDNILDVLVRNAPTLEEISLTPEMCLIKPSSNIAFPRLKSLSFWEPRLPPELKFPALQRAHCLLYHDETAQGPSWYAFDDFAFQSPKLRELEIDFEVQPTHEFIYSVMTSALSFKDLEILKISAPESVDLEGMFPGSSCVTHTDETKANGFDTLMPCQKLRQITLNCPKPDISQLINLVALHHFLAEGLDLKSARTKSSQLVRPDLSPESLLSCSSQPDRYEASARKSYLEWYETSVSGSLRRLERLELLNVHRLPPGSEQLLRKYVDDLKISYMPVM
ncbi:hypothetical protein BCV70DRAFT_221448 [Testicularia cyperi]|uniref:F-box domain-containing protein n=1 Tax=Testicularia cyperi TaxID=1882483 RepID=A0A317XH78_9BASI|nr:hypothetical protein BCV70DRAFT_221448 [Testicularia cyperi]